jgi:uncharacterized protein with ParB-like and HNH nuclease domain
METKTTIGDLFFERGIKFAIPAYQRAYSWECDSDRRQVEQFIIDIKEQNPQKEYFLGHFLFEKDKYDSKKYWVIDGQQRLTTVVIFISSMIRELEKREKSGEKLIDSDGETVKPSRIHEDYIKLGREYKFSTVSYDNPFFVNLVYENNVSNFIDSASTRRISEAKNAFDKLFAEADTSDILSWKRIMDNAVITTFKVEKKVQSTQIFAFQNDRGKDLTTLEKLKAFLMYKIYAASEDAEPEDVIKNIETEFSDIYRQSEKISFDEDRVLGFHNTAYLPGWDNPLDNVKKALADLANNNEKEQWIKDFVHTLKETFFLIETIEKKYEYNNPVADILILDTQNTMPLLIKLYHFHKDKEEAIFGMAKLVENILFKLYYTVTDYRTNSLPTIAKHYQGDLTKIENDLLSYSEKGFQWWWNFSADCKNYFTDYNWHYNSKIKYVLWKYENDLRNKQKRTRLITPNEYINKYGKKQLENTIDHITPQNPDFTKYTEDFKRDYIHNIGNLALMTWGDNSEKRNYNPVEKIKLFDKDYLSHGEIKVVLETNGIWAEDEIKTRRDNIVKFVCREWNL